MLSRGTEEVPSGMFAHSQLCGGEIKCVCVSSCGLSDKHLCRRETYGLGVMV